MLRRQGLLGWLGDIFVFLEVLRLLWEFRYIRWLLEMANVGQAIDFALEHWEHPGWVSTLLGSPIFDLLVIIVGFILIYWDAKGRIGFRSLGKKNHQYWEPLSSEERLNLRTELLPLGLTFVKMPGTDSNGAHLREDFRELFCSMGVQIEDFNGPGTPLNGIEAHGNSTVANRIAVAIQKGMSRRGLSVNVRIYADWPNTMAGLVIGAKPR